ncbi:Glycine cleavage system regulatory protein [Vibrio xiamenensis]|uniref:Glycine cleavage system transcriptional repressor n=1 Tax=Vibrio xiamenensis TaxID=861298 RepID=A0A1G7YKN9_9VIBR|nr:ACT domain-containing protein [Vibrio xiamenensis]SDG96865.1 Glycine cleavage system regulatory protein [Vibrio xiamenensis]
MNSTFIVNFVGKASPATIKQLAAITHENGGKWLVSKVNFIDDQVAAVIKVELPTQNEAIVKQAFQANPDLLVQLTDSSQHAHNADVVYQLRIDANDRAGIVNEITHVLDNQGINILDMDCQRVFIVGGAGGGGVSSSLFTASIAIKIPENVQIDDVVKELESLSEDTKVMKE